MYEIIIIGGIVYIFLISYTNSIANNKETNKIYRKFKNK